MKPLCTVLLLCFLMVPAWSQGNVNEAKQLADRLAQSQELPVNVRLRFQLLRDMMGGLASKGDPTQTLRFFSTTRTLFWNRPVNGNTGQTMREYENQVVALASQKSFNLDLPPVGYSTSTTSGGAAPAAVVANPSLLFVERATREGLIEATLRAEELGTETLAGGGSPTELLALRDSLTVLRLDLADAQVETDAIRNVLLARANYLASPAASTAPAALLQRLDTAAEALRGQFSPQLLRQARGQSVGI